MMDTDPHTDVVDDDSVASVASVALDARLRAELGRRLTLVVICWERRATDDAPDATFAALQTACAAYDEVRLLVDAPPPTVSFTAAQREEWLEATLRDALSNDADAILVWWSAPSLPAASMRAHDAAWAAADAPLRAVLVVAERLNVFDRATLALIGPGVTRGQARALGYEDGFTLMEPLATAVHAALARLTRDALARAAYRQQGSSPPCYL